MNSIIRSIIAVFLSTIALFLVSALSQFLPWSTPSVLTVDSTANGTYVFATPHLQKVNPGSLTTSEFDSTFSGHIGTLATDRSFSWIISIDRKNYSPSRFFLFELVTQFVAALGLFIALRIFRYSRLKDYLLTVVGFATLGGFAIFFTQINWWGLPITYGFGSILNLVIGWILASLIIYKLTKVK